MSNFIKTPPTTARLTVSPRINTFSGQTGVHIVIKPHLPGWGSGGERKRTGGRIQDATRHGECRALEVKFTAGQILLSVEHVLQGSPVPNCRRYGSVTAPVKENWFFSSCWSNSCVSPLEVPSSSPHYWLR